LTDLIIFGTRHSEETYHRKVTATSPITCCRTTLQSINGNI